MYEMSLPERNAALALMMREKLGIGGADRLEAKLRRARRLLPRALWKDAKYLADMENLCQNPKLARQIDSARTRRAEENLRRHLGEIDARDRRKARLLGILAPLAFNVLLLGAAIVAWLAWSGRV